MNAGTASSKAGVVAQVPHKESGEWFVLVATHKDEEMCGEGYRLRPYVVRILKSLVSSGVRHVHNKN